MSSSAKTFSESWYRIAGQSLSLRPGLRVHRQYFRGDKWYVLHDPYNNQFFRLRPAAYEFVGRLGSDRTVEEVWKECLRLHPEDAPGQEEAIRLLAQLYQSNLLSYRCPEDSLVLFKRFEKQREREIRSRIVSFMFPRITLFDPDRFLMATLPYVRWLFGWIGVALWLLVVALGVKSVMDDFRAVVDQSQALLAPGNWLWLYVALIVSKVLHEFGHAYACRNLGGEVHRMGVMFLIFTPLPFVDATSAWSFRSRRQRMHVGAAGMIVELFFAGLAAIVWSRTAPGLVHSLCYNIMFVASVSTILFNGNPLLRFDGYYILSDLLEIPNLYERALRQVRFLVERFVFGIKEAHSLARSRSEAWHVFIYAVLSFYYRIVIFGSIIFFVADRMLVLGMILAVGFFASWVIFPLGRFVHYLTTAPELARRRGRAMLATAGVLAAVVLCLAVIPFPQAFQSPGVLEGDPSSRVYTAVPGFLKTAAVEPSAGLKKGVTLAEFRNPELELELRGVAAKVKELDAFERKALQESMADLKPLQALRRAVDGQRAQLLEKQRELVVVAPQDGRWSGESLAAFKGAWMTKGVELGRVVSGPPFVFRAVVSEAEAARLFNREIRRAEIKLIGQAGQTLGVDKFEVIPAERRELPSDILGWQAGGEVRTDPRAAAGIRSAEPFFEVIARIGDVPGVALRHGLSGRIRFVLPNESLWNQWSRKARQLLQSRYKL